ncbi:MAG: hypothetical protein ACHQK9_09965 [Reyranellales bacterium]
MVLKDFEAYFDDMVVSGAVAYRKFFDATDIEPRLSDDDVMLLGARVSAYAAMGPRGPLAVVVASEAGHTLAARFFNLGPSMRSAKIFWSADKALKWLTAQPPVGP